MPLHKRFILCSVVFFSVNSVAIDMQQPLNILFIVEHFPSPSQIFILNNITGLLDRGHNVSIFSFHKDSCVDMHPNIEKYKLLDSVIYEEFPDELPECDIVFCQFGYLGKKIFKIEKLKEWLKSKKVVVCFRGFDVTGYIKNNLKIYKKVFNKVDLVLPVCNYFKKRLIRLGCNPHKIVVHHSAINQSQFIFKTRTMPESGPINLVSVCRLVAKKGIDIAISAMAKVIRMYPYMHYTIVGDGPERRNLEKLIKKLDMRDNVTISGWMSQEEVIKILDRSHIFLSPSVTSTDGDEEGIANALKEAMAAGLLAIGTWHAGTPELIQDGVNGFLVHEGNKEQLANTIEYIIRHPEVWKDIGTAAHNKIKKDFELQKSIKKLEKLFYKLVSL